MGINLGALFGPLICGYLGAAGRLAHRLRRGRRRHDARLVQYVVGRRTSPARPSASSTARRRRGSRSPKTAFTAAEWKRMGAIVIFFLVAILFWGAFEQAGSTLNLFADRYTRLELSRLSRSLVVVPVGAAVVRDHARAGVRMAVAAARAPRAVRARRNSRSACCSWRSRFSSWCPPERRRRAHRRACQPVVADRLVRHLLSSASCASSPVGLSAVTKLSPPRIVGLMMGVWLLSNAFGNKLAGSAGGLLQHDAAAAAVQ